MTEHEKLPFSIEELKQKKESLENINIEIGTILEITPEVREILGNGNYQKEQLLVRKIEILGHNLFKIEFSFPVYDIVTDDLPNEHVSIVQMQLAIVQGLFTAFGFAIKQNGANSPMSYETFLLNRGEALYRRDERIMRKKLKFNEEAHLIFKVHPFIKKGRIYSITAELLRDKATFLDGKVECIMQDQYLFDEEIKNCKDSKTTEQIQMMASNPAKRFETSKNIEETISLTDKKNEDKKDSDEQ